MSMSQREFETLQAILHHVGCYNGRQVVGVSARRAAMTMGFPRMPSIVTPVPGDIVIDGVEFRPTKGAA